MDGTRTRERIIAAATKLFYSEGLRATSVDAVAEKAGITKKTLYYHFRTKDELIAAYLASRDQPTLMYYARWFAESSGSTADKVRGLFASFGKAADTPGWRLRLPAHHRRTRQYARPSRDQGRRRAQEEVRGLARRHSRPRRRA